MVIHNATIAARYHSMVSNRLESSSSNSSVVPKRHAGAHANGGNALLVRNILVYCFGDSIAWILVQLGIYSMLPNKSRNWKVVVTFCFCFASWKGLHNAFFDFNVLH